MSYMVLFVGDYHVNSPSTYLIMVERDNELCLPNIDELNPLDGKYRIVPVLGEACICVMKTEFTKKMEQNYHLVRFTRGRLDDTVMLSASAARILKKLGYDL